MWFFSFSLKLPLCFSTDTSRDAFGKILWGLYSHFVRVGCLCFRVKERLVLFLVWGRPALTGDCCVNLVSWTDDSMCHYNYLSHLNALPNSVPCVHVKLLRDRKVQGIYHVGKKISFRNILIWSQSCFSSWEGLSWGYDGWHCKADLFGLHPVQICWTVWEQAILNSAFLWICKQGFIFYCQYNQYLDFRLWTLLCVFSCLLWTSLNFSCWYHFRCWSLV